MRDGASQIHIVGSEARAFAIETVRQTSLTRGWRSAIADGAVKHPYALAFCWDDVLVRRSRHFRIDPYEFIWPTPDPLLLGQVDSRMRCAIDRHTLRTLAREGKVASDCDTSGALAHLAALAPDRIVRLDSIYRYTRSVDAPLYKCNAPPRPTRKAKNIAVIINYRDRADLMERCIRSLGAQTFSAKLEVMLINNQSSPESRRRVVEFAQRLQHGALVRHIDYDKPFNHSAQNNIAASVTNAEVIIFLNNDAEPLTPSCLQTSADWCLEDGVACAGPQMRGDRNRLVSNGVFIRAERNTQKSLIRESDLPIFVNTIRRTCGISFCCAAISKKTWSAVGPLDELVFTTQYNDADIFVKSLKAGYRHIHVGTEICRHEPGQSEPRSKQATAERLDMFRERHPDLGGFERTDIDHIKLKRLPKFEDAFAHRDMEMIRKWRALRARIAPIAKVIARKGP